MITLDPRGSTNRARAARLDRNADRRITAAGLVVAAAFLAAAAVTSLSGVPAADGSTTWLPLHLALAGGAGVAIAAVMPFFSASLVAAPPAPPTFRAGAVALVGIGTALIATRAFAPGVGLPVLGGLTYLGGAALLAWVTLAPLRRALGPSRPIVAVAYAVALADVLAGAALATLYVAGWLPVVERWATLRPAHAWLNLLGFVSLVIAGTLVHLLPTVFGGRIVPRVSASIAVGGLALGAPLTALGLALAGGPGPAPDLLVRAGAVASAAGAGALAWHAVEVRRARGRWTTDPEWHRLATLGLVLATAWFGAAVALAAGQAFIGGASASGWRLDLVLAPLVVGWVVQAIIASWTHLVPSIGPGGPPEHARQRAILGRLATPRLVALNGGTALLAVGLPAGLSGAVVVGALLVAAALAVSLLLAAAAFLQVR